MSITFIFRARRRDSMAFLIGNGMRDADMLLTPHCGHSSLFGRHLLRSESGPLFFAGDMRQTTLSRLSASQIAAAQRSGLAAVRSPVCWNRLLGVDNSGFIYTNTKRAVSPSAKAQSQQLKSKRPA